MPDGEGQQTRKDSWQLYFYMPPYGAGNPEMGVQSPWSGVPNYSSYPWEWACKAWKYYYNLPKTALNQKSTKISAKQLINPHVATYTQNDIVCVL